MDPKKRRLQMLPEVLPTPTRAQPNTSVRSRALTRLGVLAALGAASVANACGGTSSNGGENGLPNDGGPPDGDPYGVVDPLPPPACFKEADALSAEARYVDLTDGGDDAGENDASTADAGDDSGAADAGGDSGAADAGGDAGSFSGPDRNVEVTLSWSQSGVVLSGSSGGFWSEDSDVQFLDATSTAQGARVLVYIGHYEEGRVVTAMAHASCTDGLSYLRLTLTLHGDRVDATLEER